MLLRIIFTTHSPKINSKSQIAVNKALLSEWVFWSLSEDSVSRAFTMCSICPYTAFTAQSHRHDHRVALNNFSVKCRATYLRLQITLVAARWFKTLTRDCILSNVFITWYYATTYMTHLTFISSPLYVYSFNLFGRTREYWHISWDYTIIILLIVIYVMVCFFLFFLLDHVQWTSCVICG